MSSALERARRYEAEHIKKIPEGQKPSFHVCAPIGWINDPNGFSVYHGEYHLFYQYHPYNKSWGPMHWGHSKSKDFIKWEQLPAALAPEEEYEGFGCFSGSAIEDEGKHVLLYTGVQESINADGRKEIRQTQCIAIGDGLNYEKLDCNPVIDSSMLPAGSSTEDFRDPKIWKDGELFFAVIGSRNEDGSGQVPLFSSKDLKEWNYCGVLDQCHNRYGKMWECPDFFLLDGKSVLIVSPQEMDAEGLEFHNGSGTLYLIGDYEKEQCKFSRELVGAIDYGLDFYAPQTTGTEDGRTIMVAWMKSWDNDFTPPEFKWSGMMTIPRELYIKEGMLYQMPVRELQEYYANGISLHHEMEDDTVEFPGMTGRQFDMTVEIEEGEYQNFCISLAKDERYHTDITYDAHKSIVSFNRNHAGLRRDVISHRSMHVRNQSGAIKIRILVDQYSVEIFVNDGEQAMTSLIYTNLDAERISFGALGRAVYSVTKQDIVLD